MRISPKYELVFRHRDGEGFKTRKGVTYSVYNGQIEVEHPNGFTGVFYGRHSMSIYKGDKEMVHTGSYNGKRNADELYKQVDKLGYMISHFREIWNASEVSNE